MTLSLANKTSSFSKASFIGLLLSCGVIFGCTQTKPASEKSADPEQILNIQMKNLSQPQANIFTGGQPTPDQLKQMAAAGITRVINLRTPGEINWDEEALVSELGMSYLEIPVAGAAGITLDNANSLQQAIDSNSSGATLIHCGSGNRIGALVALHSSQVENQDIESAINKGKSWGLTRLEPVVRELVSQAEQQ